MDNEQDTFGIISLIIGLLTWLSCFASCFPYLGFLAMFPSMLLCLVGTIVGAVGVQQTRAADLSPGLSIAGVVINGVPLLIWVFYWVMLLLAGVSIFAIVIAAAVAENL